MKKISVAHVLLPITALLALTPLISSGIGLIAGVLIALTFGNPFANRMKAVTHSLLAWSVVGLGFGMNLEVVGRVGAHGIGYTVLGIGIAFLLGIFLGRLLGIPRDTSTLITAGTAICGGSAIAAIAPVIDAKHHETSVALGTVFMLNALALFIFPWIGHHLNLDESQFGLWSALAIHDTSSVVGATLQYGSHALEVGTTVKLARALWIIPVAGLIGYVRARGNRGAVKTGPAKRPWFIAGFILAAAVVTWVPSLQPYGHHVEALAKRLMVLTLFFIGASLTRATIQSVGIKPFVQGVVLWIVMASGSLGAIYFGMIA
jgi:uncharacterized integral membrane protein (TIGR00698 family)